MCLSRLATHRRRPASGCWVVLAGTFWLGCSGTDTVPPPPPPPALAGAASAAPGENPGGPVAPSSGVQTAPPGRGGVSRFGTVTLSAGFNPDPHVVEGTTSADQLASQLSPECEGYVARTPDHVFVAATAFPSMRLLVNGGSVDTTLVVRRPDGSFLCDDDGAGAHQPLISGTFAPGSYRIWVGTFEGGQAIAYRLGFTELPNVSLSGVGSPGPALAADGEANFGRIALSPSFMPDPHIVRGQSGGAVDAATLAEDCRGWISERPDHLFVAEAPFEGLRVVVKSDADTTLVLRKPDGTYLCDDDSGGDRNPMLVADLPEGAYQIWVGSFERQDNAPYELGLSERPGASPAAL